MKTCKICGTAFEHGARHRQICSTACSTESARRRAAIIRSTPEGRERRNADTRAFRARAAAEKAEVES